MNSADAERLRQALGRAERYSRQIANMTRGFNAQLRAEIRKAKAAAWDEGAGAADFWHLNGEVIPANPYRDAEDAQP